ncbi:helix-turn-helix transcriptional regulator [Actinocatenispora comari]|uniref:HTH luxR-type domain-containing protein n=1 Tax=Actinocatenispora comari TaxID=2807577 RepID=A0A8J4AJU6_9ACTN|nr:LuxR C-terminal-related transcriptional regulator [Actinocatenispora comari]GIL31905.1 hypothetical protein NUM_71590 [Actinocatenispora comari]
MATDAPAATRGVAGTDPAAVLRQVRGLIDSVVDTRDACACGTAGGTDVPDAIADGPSAILDRVRRLSGAADHEILCSVSQQSAALPLLTAIERMVRQDPKPTRANVRLMCTPDLLDHAFIRSLVAAQGAGRCGELTIRMVTHKMPGLLVVDRRDTLIVSAAGGGSRAQLFSSPILAELLQLIFAERWTVAEPAHTVALLRSGRDVVQLREILLCLVQGLKDDTAARRLDMSVRTYRRHVAGILRELNVRSRVQAAIAAINMGLVRSPVPDRQEGPDSRDSHDGSASTTDDRRGGRARPASAPVPHVACRPGQRHRAGRVDRRAQGDQLERAVL